MLSNQFPLRAQKHALVACAALLGLLLPGAARAQAAPNSAQPARPAGAGDVTVGAAPVAPAPAAVVPAAEPAAPAPAEAAKGPTAEAVSASKPAKAEHKETPWYDRIKIRGYTQFRYDQLPSAKQNENLVNAQGDRYIGPDNGFGIRRARLIVFGDVHERVSIYLQTDFASVIDSQYHVPTMRDWYADLFVDKAKTFRFRVGQSKVPFGFENLQSSQNRLPLDRSDALNSAVKDERDLGVFAYWAPADIRKRFKHLVDSGLKGSGDYGVLALGAYNGQTANRGEFAKNMHGVLRLTWPFLLGEQFFEVGGGGYYGKYRVSTSDKSVVDLKDARGFATMVLYPQPFGFVAEGNYGVGPERDKTASSSVATEPQVITEEKIYGGYAQVMYKIDDVLPTDDDAIIPYVRGTYYRGGKKFETNAPGYLVKELELGIEWQIIKFVELTLAYDFAERTNPKTYYREKGQIFRAQLQVNY